MADLTLTAPRGAMHVYVSVPDGAGPWPGVLVISDALGMTTDLRNQADWLAEQGYLAAAPDLFYWSGRMRCLFTTIRQALAREGHLWEALERTRVWLADHPDSTGRVGVIGFCLGGGFAVLLAGLGDYDAASVNYGAVPKDAANLLATACPIVGSYGAKDSLAPQADVLASILADHGIAHDVHVYPDAGHSFLNDHDPAEVPRWAVVMGALSSSEYHAASADHARRRIQAFFDHHLRG